MTSEDPHTLTTENELSFNPVFFQLLLTLRSFTNYEAAAIFKPPVSFDCALNTIYEPISLDWFKAYPIGDTTTSLYILKSWPFTNLNPRLDYYRHNI